jgi:hypothetical protein
MIEGIPINFQSEKFKNQSINQTLIITMNSKKSEGRLPITLKDSILEIQLMSPGFLSDS